MMNNNKVVKREDLIKSLKKVTITGKTYTEYIAALADHLIENYQIKAVTFQNEDQSATSAEILGYCLLCEREFPVKSLYEKNQICPKCTAVLRDIKVK